MEPMKVMYTRARTERRRFFVTEMMPHAMQVKKRIWRSAQTIASVQKRQVSVRVSK